MFCIFTNLQQKILRNDSVLLVFLLRFSYENHLNLLIFFYYNRFEKICVITQLVLIGSVVRPFYFVPPKSWYFLLISDLQLCYLGLETEICNSIKTYIYVKLESENALTQWSVFVHLVEHRKVKHVFTSNNPMR